MPDANPTPRSLLAWSALLLLTAWVSVTAIRIEVLNHQMGGFLPRPQPPSMEGNDIPWRSSSRRMMEFNHRRYLLYERDGMSAAEYLDDETVMATELTPIEKTELERYLRRVEYNHQLKQLVSGPGIGQYLLVPLTVVLGVSLWPKRSALARAAVSCCIALCVGAGSLAFYRQYFQAVID